ncbi:MAG: hypothetical protein E6Q50_14110 [Lysobacter sp.]|nr:MAG: hypothetical protein E6Q50_14110 [Lysobacter sp.]
MRRIAYLIIFIASILSACDSRREKDLQPAIQAGIESLSHARADNVDMKVYSISWITELSDGQLRIVDRSQTSPSVEKNRTDLKGKKYWEVCYGISKEWVVGATYCYYLDYNTFDLLATYRTK